MSDILCFADKLLESIEKIEGNVAGTNRDEANSDSLTNENVLSTKCLLNDCLSPSYGYTNHKSTYVIEKGLTLPSYADNISDHSNLNLPQIQPYCDKNNSNVSTKGDKYMLAAQNRLVRDKQTKEVAVLSYHTGSVVKEESKSTHVTNLDAEILPDNTHHLREELEKEEVNKLAYSSFEMFIREVKEFQEKLEASKDRPKEAQLITDFIASLELKYFKLSLNYFPDNNATVSKVKMLITRFIEKCRKDTSIGTIAKIMHILDSKRKQNPTTTSKRRNTWRCALCGKVTSVSFKKCIVCGRHRGYREKDYTKNIRNPGPLREEKQFLEENDYVQKMKGLHQATSEERKQKQYLYNKRDFEVDSRTQLKDDVTELLDSIRDFI